MPPSRYPARPAPSAITALRPWSRIWRYLIVIVTGLLLWIIIANDYLGPDPDDVVGDAAAVIGAALLLDLLLGVLAICLLPLRRRLPVIVALVTTLFTAFSASAFGAAGLAVISLSTRRHVKPVIGIGLAWMAATLFYEFALRSSVATSAPDFPSTWVTGGLALAVYAVCTIMGFYIGARRELLASLHDRLANAEREQALREDSAREAERTRIAREMHDVLAHHISLISLHAGALSYRTDLRREEAATAATVIQSNAQLALTELREILGVLRNSRHDDDVDRPAGRGGARPVEPPQPTLRELPALLADARDAGTEVVLDADELEMAAESESMSRTAYRIVQETLTNARKHAPGETVTVRLRRTLEHVRIEVENRLPAAAAAHDSPADARGSGVGLTGLRERAELAGGTLEHGVTREGLFRVRASLPWA